MDNILTLALPVFETKTPNLHALSKHFITNMEAAELLGHSIDILNQSNIELCQNAIDLLHEMVPFITQSDELRPSMGTVTQAFNAYLAHESINIRKSCILCYAAIVNIFEPGQNNTLTKSQRHNNDSSCFTSKSYVCGQQTKCQ